MKDFDFSRMRINSFLMIQEVLQSSNDKIEVALRTRDGLWTVNSASFRVEKRNNDGTTTHLSYSEMKEAFTHIEFEHSEMRCTTVPTCVFDTLSTFKLMGAQHEKTEFSLPIDFGSYVLGTCGDDKLLFIKSTSGDKLLGLRVVVSLNLQQVHPHQLKLLNTTYYSQALVTREFKNIEFSGSERILKNTTHMQYRITFSLASEAIYFTFTNPVKVSNVDFVANGTSLKDFIAVTCVDGHYRMKFSYPLIFDLIEATLVLDFSEALPTSTDLIVFNLGRVHYDPSTYTKIIEPLR